MTEETKVYTNAEIACVEMFDQIEEIFSSLVVLKDYINTDSFNKIHATHMIDGLIRQLINNQCDMMNQAKLEF
jgi:hypothetical protein